MPTLLDGRALSKRLNKALKYIAQDTLQRPPGLAVVLVGADPASQVYVRRKGVVAGRIGGQASAVFGSVQCGASSRTHRGRRSGEGPPASRSAER